MIGDESKAQHSKGTSLEKRKKKLASEGVQTAMHQKVGIASGDRARESTGCEDLGMAPGTEKLRHLKRFETSLKTVDRRAHLSAGPYRLPLNCGVS